VTLGDGAPRDILRSLGTPGFLVPHEEVDVVVGNRIAAFIFDANDELRPADGARVGGARSEAGESLDAPRDARVRPTAVEGVRDHVNKFAGWMREDGAVVMVGKGQEGKGVACTCPWVVVAQARREAGGSGEVGVELNGERMGARKANDAVGALLVQRAAGEGVRARPAGDEEACRIEGWRFALERIDVGTGEFEGAEQAVASLEQVGAGGKGSVPQCGEHSASEVREG